MPKPPRRASKEPGFEGSRSLSEIVALNVRTYRAARGLKQDDLVDLMGKLGHRWVRATVSEVERGRRNLTVDELGGLAVVLHTSIPRLFQSLAYDTRVDVGGPAALPWHLSGVLVGLNEIDPDRAREIALCAGLEGDAAQRGVEIDDFVGVRKQTDDEDITEQEE